MFRLLGALIMLFWFAAKMASDKVVQRVCPHPDSDVHGFQYRVVGQDSQWMQQLGGVLELEIGKTETVEVSFLDASGNFSAPIRIEVVFEKPFWTTWWFGAGLAVVLGGVFLFLNFRHKKRPSGSKKAQVEEDYLETQLQTLRNQISPHFLFNSFNTLAALIEDRPDAAISFLENMSDYYRRIFWMKDLEAIPLKDELELLKTYGFMLKSRFEDGFSLSVEVEDTWGHGVVPFCLQVLMDEMVRRSIISTNRPFRIHVHDRIKGYLSFECSRQEKNNETVPLPEALKNLTARFSLSSPKEVFIQELGDLWVIRLPLLPLKN